MKSVVNEKEKAETCFLDVGHKGGGRRKRLWPSLSPALEQRGKEEGKFYSFVGKKRGNAGVFSRTEKKEEGSTVTYLLERRGEKGVGACFKSQCSRRQKGRRNIFSERKGKRRKEKKLVVAFHFRFKQKEKKGGKKRVCGFWPGRRTRNGERLAEDVSELLLDPNIEGSKKKGKKGVEGGLRA